VTALINPDSPVAAYCAPGLKAYATRLLEDRGEVVREVIEHPWMAGRTDIILATDPGWHTRPHQPEDPA
jgi:hypothetical protein